MIDEKKRTGWRRIAVNAIRAVVIAWRYLTGNPPKRYSADEREILRAAADLAPGDRLTVTNALAALAAGEITDDQLAATFSDRPAPAVLMRRLGAMLVELDLEAPRMAPHSQLGAPPLPGDSRS